MKQKRPRPPREAKWGFIIEPEIDNTDWFNTLHQAIKAAKDSVEENGGAVYVFRAVAKVRISSLTVDSE
jgi:hypothetical protein